MKIKKIKSYSIVKALDGLILLIVLILIINTIVSLDSVRTIRQNNIQTFGRTVSSYGAHLDERFASARHFIEWTGVRDPVLKDIERDTPGELREDLNTFRSRLNELSSQTGNVFMFFLNLEPETTDSFYPIAPIRTSYDEYLAMRQRLITVSSQKGNLLRWATFSTADHTYLYYAIIYRGIGLYSVVPVDALTDGFNSISIGRKGYISFATDSHHEILRMPGRGQGIFSFFYRDFSYPKSSDGVPFSIRVRADVYNAYGEQLLRQMLIIALLLIVVIASALYISKLYRVILMPVERFYDQLSAISDEDGFIHIDSSPVRELDAANTKFRELTGEIKRLRIEMYEEELEKKKAQITFLQHQIRPHFYLNCLSTIDSMAHLDNTEGISDMVRFTSTYMRYLFQADKDFVPMEYELTHIKAYMNIQNMRMGEQFSYSEELLPSELSVMIPPLLLITFAENSVKHAIPSDGGKLRIRIQVSDMGNGNEKIEIADSGQGFPSDRLKELTQKAAQPFSTPSASPSGHGIGIANSIQRLSLLYAEKYSLSFFNGNDENYPGAHIVLIIPRVTGNALPYEAAERGEMK